MSLAHERHQKLIVEVADPEEVVRRLRAALRKSRRGKVWPIRESVESMIDFSVYTASDADEMVRLLGEVFPQRDPPAVAIGLTPAEFESFVRLFCPNAAVEALTIVARSAGTGEMVGTLLTQDSAAAPPDGMDHLSARFDPIFDILGQLDAEYWTGRAIRPGESVHLFLLGVAPRFAGQGIAHRLVSTCLAHATARKYRVAVTEATNKTSQHVFRKQGFVERVRRSYHDHRIGGRAFFETIADQGGPVLMDKQLAPAVTQSIR